MRLLSAFGWFLTFGIPVYLLVLFGTLLSWDLMGIADHDGGGAMGLIFIIAPAAAIIVGLAGSIHLTGRAQHRTGSGKKEG